MKFIDGKKHSAFVRCVLTAVGATLLAATTPPAFAARPEMPDIRLPKRVQGDEAVRNLGDKLPAVAEHYGMTHERLKGILHRDRNAWLDEQGRLLYIDTFLPRPKTASASAVSVSAAAPAPLDLSQTFKLHSKAGSQHVIYLDFNGYVATNTAWNSGTINAPAFTLDGDPSTFNDEEKTEIQYIWQRVVEDYAPFDVDITTEEPTADKLQRTSSSDQTYGTRAVITNSSINVCSGCGGIAYVGVFNYTSSSNPSYYQPAWVFYDNLADGDEKDIAEAISHEVGHTLGLSHDGLTDGTEYYEGHGSGATGWAPIMGVGYYQELVQWSKGEYPNANNTEDDISIMQTYGAALRTDDFGNTISTASALGGTATAVNQSGLIERNSDVDVFKLVAAAGTINLIASPAPRGPDLDIAMTLMDSAGNAIVTANDPSGLSATISTNVAAGTYYVKIDGVGDTNPSPGYSDYASLGAYVITGNYPNPNVVAPVANVTATPVSGTAPLTVNFDGSQSTDSDGTIVSYAWAFGDGGTSTAVSPTHTYSAGGTFAAKLTVTDSQGLTGSKAVTITVQAPVSQPPNAVATASTLTGTAPLAVNFTGSNSTDSDGTIASYQWAFGDGGTSTSANPQHTYTAAGSYTATLTVTDNSGLTGSDALNIVVSSGGGSYMYVGSIDMRVASLLITDQCIATVTIRDSSNQAVSGATVTGAWTGIAGGTVSGTTSSSGVATLSSKTVLLANGTCKFTVNNVAKTGVTYKSSANVETSDSAKY